MATEKVITACPRDCQDCCSLEVEVQEGKIIRVDGDKNHPVTRGFACPRGRSYPELVYSSERILKPLLKKEGNWEEISWKEALDLIEKKIRGYLETYGPESIFNYHYSGSESITKKVTMRLFDRLGATGVTGDLCMQAGVSAQKYDFGGLEQSDLTDLPNARGCVVWGRNVRVTHPHALPFIREGRDKGMSLATINPLSTGIEDISDLIIRPKPGTDAALALGTANYLIQKELIDRDFIFEHIHGFEAFREAAEEYDLEKTSAITGVEEENIVKLAWFYKNHKPVTTLLGYGLTRYRGGGNIIRAIDALAAITGNIGEAGAGVSYCSDRFWFLGKHLQGQTNPYRRNLDMANLAEEIQNSKNPPLKMGFINAANPVVNVPDTDEMQKALQGLDFLVVVDLFLTDTAKEADLFLPCTSFFEEEGVRVSSWSPWVFYCPKIIEPLGEARPDEEIMIELAKRLRIKDFPWLNRKELLEWAAEPLEEIGLNLEELREKGHILPSNHNPIAWEGRHFKTPSRRIELFSKKAKEEGNSPVANYLPPLGDNYELPFQLISAHSQYRIHSQFQVTPYIKKLNPEPRVIINPDIAEKRGLEEEDLAIIFNDRGEITARVEIDNRIRPGVIQVESGWDISSGACVNSLLPPHKTEMGDCGALYDVRADIKKKE